MSSGNVTVPPPASVSFGTLFVGFYAMSVIIFGTTFNIVTLVILCRSTFKNVQTRPTLHYMRTMAVFDILMFYGWNLNHYLQIIHGVHIMKYSLAACKIMSFLSYFAPQSSAWLRIFVCFDRYLALSRLHRTWFGRSKSVLIIIASIVTTMFLLNFHFFPFVCYYKPNGTVSVYSWLYRVYPLWDNVNLVVYNFIPLILMVTLNGGVIYQLTYLRRTTIINNSQIQHRSISITLVITTTLFLVMTMPTNLAFSFLPSVDPVILWLLDCIAYSYHAISFPLYIFTFDEFRQDFFATIGYNRNKRRVATDTRSVPFPPTIIKTKTSKF